MNELYQYALDNYEAGGHWIVECWDAADYNDILEECNGDVAAAKLVIRDQWEMIRAQERECAWGAPDEAAY